MIRKTRVRTAAAAAALATSVAIAVAATGAARADNSIPQPAADGVPAAASDAAPPGAAAFGARDEVRGAGSYVVTAGDSYWAIAEDILPDGAANGDCGASHQRADEPQHVEARLRRRRHAPRWRRDPGPLDADRRAARARRGERRDAVAPRGRR